MKTPYSRSYFPPAPVVSVRLTLPEESPRPEFHQALIEWDTIVTVTVYVFYGKWE